MELCYIRYSEKNFSDVVRGSQERRKKDKSIIDQIIVLDILWKKMKYKFDLSKNFMNNTSTLIGKFNQLRESKIQTKIVILKKKIILLEKIALKLLGKRDSIISLLANLVHNNANLENADKIMRRKMTKDIVHNFSDGPKFSHVELLRMIGGVDYEKGVKTAGNRGYFLKGIGLLLNNSLIRFGIDYLIKKQFIALQTPFFMNKLLLSKCSQLDDFKEQLYSLNNDDDKYLIATSEQPISVFHLNENIENTALPLKYVGFSSCFRKESGSHGKDTSGIFRVHQFEKVEQFILADSDGSKSWECFNELLENAKKFYSLLGIPYRLINISSSSLNNTAATKIDLLGFFPKSNTFRELVSCSNCTSYQSKKINTRIKTSRKNDDTAFVHMLNSTLCATSRVICCILENYQSSCGISIPAILRNYTGVSFVPFNISP